MIPLAQVAIGITWSSDMDTNRPHPPSQYSTRQSWIAVKATIWSSVSIISLISVHIVAYISVRKSLDQVLLQIGHLNYFNSQGYYLDRCHEVCTWPSWGWHLYNWHMVKCPISAKMLIFGSVWEITYLRLYKSNILTLDQAVARTG